MATTKGFRFDLVLSNFRKNELVLARYIAGAQRDYALEAFRRQRFGSDKWKQVQRRIKGTPEYKYPKKKGLSRRVKPILTNTGTLRRAVNNSIYKVTPKVVVLRVDLPYAAIHNEGGTTWNGGKIAKRQFIGWNKELDRTIRKLINNTVKGNFKS